MKAEPLNISSFGLSWIREADRYWQEAIHGPLLRRVALRLTGFAVVVAAAILVSLSPCQARGANGLQGATILIIRHAEKPIEGRDLSVEGQRHAEAYVKYFSTLELDSKPLKPDALFAAADSKNSRRPRMTLEPLAHALNLPLDLHFKDKEPEALAAELKNEAHGRHLLICWHHGKIPDLLLSLGADPTTLLPDGKWPDNQFSWVIELQYDGEGNLIPAQCRRIEENIQYSPGP